MIGNLTTAAPLLAYLGPGGALTLIGSALALLAAIIIAFFGLVWYPLKRLIRWWRGPRKRHVGSEDSAPAPEGSLR